MNGLAPRPLTRWIIGIVVGFLFALPLVSTLLFTLKDGTVDARYRPGLAWEDIPEARAA